jgi:hypothetical protein
VLFLKRLAVRLAFGKAFLQVSHLLLQRMPGNRFDL